MRITDRFRSEHAVFVEQLDVLGGLLDGGAPTDAFLAALRDLAAPLGRHAQREEDALFPELVFDDDAKAPIRVLTEEHDLIEGWIERMTAGLPRAELRSVFDELRRTLRAHIVREDAVMFPLAERILDEAELVALDEGMAEIRT